MSITALIPLVGGLTSLASEFIEDPDKKAEFETRKHEAEQQLLIALSQQTTTPFADSAVKIITALVALARPIGSFGLFIFGLLNVDLMQQLASMGTAGELAVENVRLEKPDNAVFVEPITACLNIKNSMNLILADADSVSQSR
ncbi:MAG: hypothetical protein H7842_14285 [Gammaproteobacteria bacterium SHHR-1]